jgi:hypothetical protein
VRDQHVEDRFVGLQEAGLLVLEHFVEDVFGDTGELDHVGDGCRLVAFCRRHPHHRLQQPLALGADDVSARQSLLWIRCG